MRVGQERLDDATAVKIFERLHAADTDDEVAAARVAVDLLRRMHQAPDRDTARRRLVAFYEWTATVEIDEVTRLARTIDTWQDEVLVLRHARLERADRVRKHEDQVASSSPRVRNCGNYRARILLHAGQPRKVPTTTRIRSYTVTAAA